MPEMTVEPCWELTFDAEGNPHPAQLRRLERQAAQEEITDLVFFAHGWNNDRHLAERLHSRFFAPFPKLTKGARRLRVGYVGVLWPSMRFPDELIPDFDGAAGAASGTALDARTRRTVGAQFPGRPRTVERIAALLEERPNDDAGRAEFVRLVRHLTSAPGRSAAARLSADTDDEAPDAAPVMLEDEDATETFEEFTGALRDAGGNEAAPAGLWSGGREILRQAAYGALKRRAGTVGAHGLGPVLGRLAAACPGTRLHLVGHSLGARLAAFALRGLPEGAVKATRPASVTLLQGAFSHYAFAEKLPHDKERGGALRGMQRRVEGPVVSCFSHHDVALGKMYPLASRLARDFGGERYGALGHDGVKGITTAKRLTLDEALDGPFPAKGCVSVDVGKVVRRGGPPAGAHSDICHAELARVVLAAGRVGG